MPRSGMPGPTTTSAVVEVTDVAELPWGVRPLESLRLDEAQQVGEELADLVVLRAGGVHCADGWLVALSGDHAGSRLAQAVVAGLGRTEGRRVRLRPLFPSRALAARFERRADLSWTVSDPSRAATAAKEFLTAVGAPDITAAVGGSLARLHALVSIAEDAPEGRAASADPVDGDPDQIRVWEAAVTPWLVDRRSARVTARGEGQLDQHGVSLVADLADRAQLVLGFAVQISWVIARGRPVVEGLRPLSPAPRFTTAPYRLVALISEDEGCVAPLSVDALDKALRHDSDVADEPRVRRLYARAYRRMVAAPPVRSRSSNPGSLARAAARAARVAADLAAPLSAARAFERGLVKRLDALDAADLSSLDDRALIEAVRERQRLVIEALILLDRGRLATIAVLAALESAVGALPREALPALAMPKPSRARRRLYDRMGRLARRIEQEVGELGDLAELSPALMRKWEELRRDVADVRPLGIDVRPLPYGHDGATLLETLRATPWEDDESRERARRDALRRILATAGQRPFGRARKAMAGSLGLLVFRVARSKGALAEGLAAGLLRLRRAACEAGRRLADLGLVDEPEDALYLSLDEIEQGLAGEPGAYAARVRLRREDDLRWARHAAPRRIAARRG